MILQRDFCFLLANPFLPLVTLIRHPITLHLQSACKPESQPVMLRGFISLLWQYRKVSYLNLQASGLRLVLQSGNSTRIFKALA